MPKNIPLTASPTWPSPIWPSPIWKDTPTLEQLNAMNPGTIHIPLGIEFTAIGDDFLEATMPVDARTQNPRGILHGGASVVLAESLGSVASVLVAGPGEKTAAGIEINASHLSSASHGYVLGRVTPVRLGRTLHVWDIQIRQGGSLENPKMICRSRLTVIIQDLRQNLKMTGIKPSTLTAPESCANIPPI